MFQLLLDLLNVILGVIPAGKSVLNFFKKQIPRIFRNRKKDFERVKSELRRRIDKLSDARDQYDAILRKFPLPEDDSESEDKAFLSHLRESHRFLELILVELIPDLVRCLDENREILAPEMPFPYNYFDGLGGRAKEIFEELDELLYAYKFFETKGKYLRHEKILEMKELMRKIENGKKGIKSYLSSGIDNSNRWLNSTEYGDRKKMDFEESRKFHHDQSGYNQRLADRQAEEREDYERLRRENAEAGRI